MLKQIFNFQFSIFKKNEGLTLVELILVIAILAVLFAALMAVLDPIQQIRKANDARRKSDLDQIKHALELYFNDHGKYPAPDPSNGCNYDQNCYVYSKTGGRWIPALTSAYLQKIPLDPTNNAASPWVSGNYSYSYGNVTSDGQHYDLTAQLENKTDPDRCGIKGYRYYEYMPGYGSTGIAWCPGENGNTFGGSYSNYIYEAGN